MEARVIPIAEDTFLIDLLFQGEPEVIAAYLLVDREPTLVEAGPTSCLERLLAGVRAAGVEPEALRQVCVTHVHLDHAGGAGELLRRYPSLTLFVHPVGAPHLVDPTRLVRSAARLYGPEMETLWGAVVAAPADRVRVLPDGARLSLGRRELVALDTPGHAKHHLAFLEPGRGWLFTGDVAGVRLPGSDYVLPPTPPPDIDLELWYGSLERLAGAAPRRLLLTHFGETDDPAGVLAELRQRLHGVGEAVREGLAAGLAGAALVEYYRASLELPPALQAGARGARLERASAAAINVEGLVRYWTKRQERPGD